MFTQTRLIALASLGLVLGSCQGEAEERMDSKARPSMQQVSANPSTTASKDDQIDMKKLSEAFGHFIGRNLQSPGLKFDLENIIKGIREGAAGQPAPLSEKEYEEMMAAVQERAFKEMSTTNLKTANEFLERNSKEKGVVEVVPGKLQYLILQQGSGPAVDVHSSPKIHYTGRYQDGTVFGTSEEMGGPITIPLDQTIPGFSKGIVGMREGEKRRLFVHPDLGYGTTGQLPPNELLIFEVDVVKANTDDEKEKGRSAAQGKDHDERAGGDQDDEEELYMDEEEYDREPHNPKGAQSSGTKPVGK